LESLELQEVEMTDLRPFKGLTKLRDLSLMGRLKSLEGIQALTGSRNAGSAAELHATCGRWQSFPAWWNLR
jgi:hypothetical protein